MLIKEKKEKKKKGQGCFKEHRFALQICGLCVCEILCFIRPFLIQLHQLGKGPFGEDVFIQFGS